MMGRLVGARAAIAALLEAGLDGPKVSTDPESVKQLTADTVVVMVDKANSADPDHPGDWIELEVAAIGAAVLDDAAEHDLEAFADAVLDVLDAGRVLWKDATRETWKSGHPCYRITLEYMP